MKRSPAIIIAIIVLAGALISFGTRNAQPRPSPTADTQTLSDRSDGGKYLYIKEWGVRFKLPDQLQGKVIYATKNNTDVTLPNANPGTLDNGDEAFLTTDAFALLPDSTCKLNLSNGDHGGRVFISRTTQNDSPYSSSGVKAAGYNYVASGGNGGLCSSGSNQDAELEFIGQIVSSYKSLEVVK